MVVSKKKKNDNDGGGGGEGDAGGDDDSQQQQHVKRQEDEKPQKQPHQYDCRRGWMYMAIYWLIGALVGWIGNYYDYFKIPSIISLFSKVSFLSSIQDLPSIIVWDTNNDNNDYNQDNKTYYYYYIIVAWIVTLSCQLLILPRFDSFGRTHCWIASILFAILNGTFETILFVATYDGGKWIATNGGNLLGWTTTNSRAVIFFGFFMYNIYSGLIHALFWLPYALPYHTRSDAAPFHTSMLPALQIMSIAWFTIYEQYNDLPSVCMMHMAFNLIYCRKICLPPPFGGQEGRVDDDVVVKSSSK